MRGLLERGVGRRQDHVRLLELVVGQRPAVAALLWRLRDRLPAGGLFALYLVLAGLERFLIEFIRRNEEVALGLSTAQYVSLVMVAAGVVWIWRTPPLLPRRAPARRTARARA